VLHKGLQSRIMAALAVVTLFSIIVLGLVAYWSERDALQDQLSLELTSSVEYTQQRLQDWLRERHSDVRFLAANASNQESVQQLLFPNTTQTSRQFHLSRLKASLLSMQQARPEYKRILIADSTGLILVATDPALIGQSVAEAPSFAATLRLAPADHRGYVEDISYNKELDTYVMYWGYPLVPPNHLPTDAVDATPAVMGVVLVMVDVQKTVYPILTEWRTGESGTAVLSRAEGEETRILNAVLGDIAPPLTRLLPVPLDLQQAKPAYWAARGGVGTQITVDHLGVEVLTVYRYIPEMKWGLVLKMNTSEVFAPLHLLVSHVVYIAIGVLLVALFASIAIARTLTKPLAALVTTARTVAVGKAPVYTALERKDEIGILARSFREMVEALQRQQQQLKAANEVASSILGSRPIQETLTELVQAAQHLTGSQVAQITLHEPTDQAVTIAVQSPRDVRIEQDALAQHGSGSEQQRVQANGYGKSGYSSQSNGSLPLDSEGPAADNFVVMPIRSRDHDFGIFQVQKERPNDFTSADHDTLQVLTTYAAVALENARLVHHLKSWNAELEQRVEERTHELAEANQRLMVLDKMKDDLLCSISHELRNPISNLKLQLDLLHGNIDSPRRQKYLASLVVQVNTLANLVTDMLDLIQIDGMASQLVFTPFNFCELVTDIVNASSALLQETGKNLKIIFESQSQPLYIRGEQAHLYVAVTHLLRNAMNFTPNGEIRVQLWEKEGECCLQVQDTGMGIAKDDLPHIFERFFRGANVSQSTIPGSGLGLSVVEKIATTHGGRVVVTSQLGQGSTFRLWLPLLETNGSKNYSRMSA
jgi:signal transduction histidine kinase/HAMP domain-containing protein